MFSFKQATIAASVTIEGRGIHLGNKSLIKLMPAQAATGLIFIHNGETVRYHYPAVKGSARGTNISISGEELNTVEHLISALVGMGIDNCTIEIVGDEIPIIDGSAKIFVEKIQQAGIVYYDKEKQFIKIEEPIVISDEKGRSLIAVPANQFEVTFLFEHPLMDPQIYNFNLFRDDYASQVAPARTFGFQEEVKRLQEQGYIKGADIGNAILIKDKQTSTELRFSNEMARHKVLDLIGDIYAAGALPLAHIYAIRSGHKFNSELVKELIS